VATWLMSRMCVDDSLAGDLVEQYLLGRSPLWLWRQVLGAIVVSSAHLIWRHRILALRALMIGWGASYVFGKCYWEFVISPLGLAPQGLQRLQFVNALFLVTVLHRALLWASTGWLVGRLHRPYQRPMVLAFLSTILFAHHIVAVLVTVFSVLVGGLIATGERMHLRTAGGST
jgi:hypothetical protein